jgi:polar amino acid transport system substrate-binding protein
MKKKFIVLVILIFVPCILFAAQPTSLKFATIEYPPFIHQNGDSAEGETIDTVTEIFSRIGITLKIAFYPAARGLKMVSDGDADAFFTLKKNAERETTMLFPKEPLIRQDFVLFVLKDSKVSFNGNLSEMKNVNIGVVNKTSYGSLFDSAVKKGEFKKLDIAQNFEASFKKLLAGRVDAVISSRDNGNHILKTLGAGAETKVKVTGPPVQTVASYLAFTKVRNYKELANSFDKIINEMKKDGTIDKIKMKYK